MPCSFISNVFHTNQMQNVSAPAVGRQFDTHPEMSGNWKSTWDPTLGPLSWQFYNKDLWNGFHPYDLKWEDGG